MRPGSSASLAIGDSGSGGVGELGVGVAVEVVTALPLASCTWTLAVNADPAVAVGGSVVIASFAAAVIG